MAAQVLRQPTTGKQGTGGTTAKKTFAIRRRPLGGCAQGSGVRPVMEGKRNRAVHNQARSKRPICMFLKTP